MHETLYQKLTRLNEGKETGKRVLALLITLLLVILIIIVGNAVISNATAKIVAIKPDEHWGNPVGMTTDYWFNVTIHNYSNSAAENLKLNVTITNSSTTLYNWGLVDWNRETHIGTIQPSETATVSVFFSASYDNFDQVAGRDVVVQLMLGDRVLDEGSFWLNTRAWG